VDLLKEGGKGNNNRVSKNRRSPETFISRRLFEKLESNTFEFSVSGKTIAIPENGINRRLRTLAYNLATATTPLRVSLPPTNNSILRLLIRPPPPTRILTQRLQICVVDLANLLIGIVIARIKTKTTLNNIQRAIHINSFYFQKKIQLF
jgi:hypothetical protein